MPTPPETPPVEPGPEGPPGSDDPTERVQARVSPYLKILRRMLRTLTALFQAHVMVIQAEAEGEAVRVASGMALVFGAGALSGVSALLGGVVLVALIQRLSGLPWLESIALAMATTMVLAALLATTAWLILRRPLLPKSRKLLKSTFDGITGG